MMESYNESVNARDVYERERARARVRSCLRASTHARAHAAFTPSALPRHWTGVQGNRGPYQTRYWPRPL